MNKKLKTILTYGSASVLTAGTVVGASLSLTSCSNGVDLLKGRSSWYVDPITSESDNYEKYNSKTNDVIMAQYLNDVIASEYKILRSDFISLGYDLIRKNNAVDNYKEARLDLKITEYNAETQTFSGNIFAHFDDGTTVLGRRSVVEIDIDFHNFTLLTKITNTTGHDKISFDLVAEVENDWSITVNEMSIDERAFVVTDTQGVPPGTVINEESPEYVLFGPNLPSKHYNFTATSKVDDVNFNSRSLLSLVGDIGGSVAIGSTSNYLNSITPSK